MEIDHKVWSNSLIFQNLHVGTICLITHLLKPIGSYTQMKFALYFILFSTFDCATPSNYIRPMTVIKKLTITKYGQNKHKNSASSVCTKHENKAIQLKSLSSNNKRRFFFFGILNQSRQFPVPFFFSYYFPGDNVARFCSFLLSQHYSFHCGWLIDVYSVFVYHTTLGMYHFKNNCNGLFRICNHKLPNNQLIYIPISG